MCRCVTVLAVLSLAAMLAGCMGGEDAPDAETDGEVPGDDGEAAAEEALLEAPSWEVGDWWTWSTDQQGEVTLVVTGEDGGDWVVDTTNEDVAFFHARFPVSYLGEIRKADLAGSQPDARVAFFEWPLEANETWTTTWDGVEREITVDRIEDGTAHLTARQDDRVAVEYTYDAARGSFGELVFLDANGTTTFAMQPRTSGSSFDEPVVRWQLEQAIDEEGTFGAEPVSWGTSFDVDEEVTDLWLDLAIDCPSGTYQFGFSHQEEDEGYGQGAACPDEAREQGPVVEDPTPGTYEGGFTGTSPEADGEHSITLYVRTLVEVPVGEG